MQATTNDRGAPSEVELRMLVDELERAVQSLAERLGRSLHSGAVSGEANGGAGAGRSRPEAGASLR